MNKLISTNVRVSILEGGEVYRYRNGKPNHRPIKGALRLGEELLVPTLFGIVKAKITECGDDTAMAETEGLLLPLHFKSDDRGCWTSSMALNKRGIAKFLPIKS